MRALEPRMEKPAFYPAEERGRGLVGVSSLSRKVTGVLSEGYLGAGMRRLAPKKAEDLTLK